MSNKIQIAKNFSIPAIDYAGQGNSIIGIRGSGKSYTAGKLAEGLMKANIPILVFDPTSIWRHLRTGVNGHKGFPIVVAGGLEPDIPLTKDNAVDIVRAAMKEGISLVIDLFGLSGNERINIVSNCVKLLLDENHKYGMRHVIIEEAPRFIPQRSHPGNQVVAGRIEEMAQIGRNFGIGYTLLSQRSQEIHKAVFELCEMVIVHRQTGKNSLKAIIDWFDYRGLEDRKKIVDTIPKLVNGQCWIVNEETETLINVLQKETFHPNPKDGKIVVPKNALQSDRASFIKKLNEQVKVTEQELKDIKDLKKENNRLKDELAKAIKSGNSTGSVPGTTSEKDAKLIADLQYQIKVQEAEITSWKKIAVDRGELLKKIKNLAGDEIYFPTEQELNKSVSFSAKSETKGHKNDMKMQVTVPKAQVYVTSNNGSLPASELRILTACAQYPNGLNRQQITGLVGLKKSSRDTYIARLKQKGMITQNGDRVIPTDEGVKFLGPNFQALPTGKALQDYWATNLPSSEWKILQAAIDGYPNIVTRESLTDMTGLLKSSRDTYIARLKQKELITTPAAGEIRAAEILFN